MNEAWICVAGDKKLVVQCADVMTAYEVRQFAAKRLGTDPSAVVVRMSDLVEVRWVGDDYAHGGTLGGRRLQERAPGAEWGDS